MSDSSAYDLIVGSDGGGLSAALTAIAGASVLVLEKTGQLGGSTVMVGAGASIEGSFIFDYAAVKNALAAALGVLRAVPTPVRRIEGEALAHSKQSRH